jgi:ribosomal protein S18 acetylase RimI-like enzyme
VGHTTAVVTSTVEADAQRFAAWQTDAFTAVPEGSEVLDFGPFRALVTQPKSARPEAWVTLVDAEAAEAETRKALTKLKTLLKRRHAPLEIEYNETAFPQIGGWLKAGGLTLEETNPLMACRPATFKPFSAPEVHLTQLIATATPAELEAFQRIRWTDGGDVERDAPSVESLQTALGRATSVYLLAWIDWEPAGTGVSHSLNGAAEIVGVVTNQKARRRGVAATVTSELVRRHFETGGDFVFLDAANEEAARVYERLGFARFGANLVWR